MSFRYGGFRDRWATWLPIPSAWSERRDSNPLRPVLQTGASTTSASPTDWQGTSESNRAIPGLESGALPIEPVPPCWFGVSHGWFGVSHGGPGGSRTHNATPFEGAGYAILLRACDLVGRERLELSCTSASGSEPGASARFRHRPMVPGKIAPPRRGLGGRTRTCDVHPVGTAFTARCARRLATPRKLELSKIGKTMAESKRLERLCPQRELRRSKPDGRSAAHALRELPIKSG